MCKMEQSEVLVVSIVLDVNEVNVVLAALQELPHRVADPILRKVIGQAEQQLTPPVDPAE